MVFGFFSRKQAGPAQAATGTSPTPTPPPPDPSPSPSPDEVVTDPAKLHALIASVPAQTFHAYTLLHLSPSPQSPFPILSTPALLGQEKPLEPPSSQTLTVLSAFFSSLRPPPKQHCVRCHNGFFELENTDTSCRIQHDDESAIVDRVKTGYETLWGCCGRTVEGDGDMGPPDGWCYEGRHTSDTKRARFRADSTPSDDKLASCEALRCNEPIALLRPGRGRGAARKRKTMDVDEEAEAAEALNDDEGSVTSSLNTRSSNKGKLKESPDGETKRPMKRRRSRKQSTVAISNVTDGDGDVHMDVDGSAGPSTATPPTMIGTPSVPKSSTPKGKKKASTVIGSSAKPISKSSTTSTRPTYKSPLANEFRPTTPPAQSVPRPLSRAASASPTQSGSSRTVMEVSLLKKASIVSLRAKGSLASVHMEDAETVVKAAPKKKRAPRKSASVVMAKPLEDVVATSIDGDDLMTRS